MEIDIGVSRKCILDVAEKHFHKIWFQGTAVADIVSSLGF
jgi:hypothetical protein